MLLKGNGVDFQCLHVVIPIGNMWRLVFEKNLLESFVRYSQNLVK
jgi:hypothetical protein